MQWTPGHIISRSIETLHREGLRSLYFKILAETMYRRLLLLERPLTQPPPDITPGIPVEFDMLGKPALNEFLDFRLVSESDVQFFTGGGREAPDTLIRRRLAAGHQCYLARHVGRIVSASWAAPETGPVSYLDCELWVGSDGVYIYDSFTRPSFRGHNLAPTLAAEMIRLFGGTGQGAFVTAIAPENRSNLRARAKVGFRVCGRFGYVGFGPWKQHFCTSEHYRIRRRGQL